jgi:hypothetical protein
MMSKSQCRFVILSLLSLSLLSLSLLSLSLLSLSGRQPAGVSSV